MTTTYLDHPGNPVKWQPFPVDSLWVLFHSSHRYGQGVCIDRLDRRSGRTSDIHQTLHSDLMNFGPLQCQENKHYTIHIVYHMYMYIYIDYNANIGLINPPHQVGRGGTSLRQLDLNRILLDLLKSRGSERWLINQGQTAANPCYY